MYSRIIYKVFLGLIFILMVTLAPSYGMTWDERVQRIYGQLVLQFFLSGFQDQDALTFENLYLYGGLFDLLAALVERFVPWHFLDVRHVINAAFGFIGILYAGKTARQVEGTWAGTIAILLLALSPRYVGHAMNNPKDIPFAATYVMACYQILRLYGQRGAIPLGRWVGIATAIALCINIRVGGVLLLGYLGVAGVLYCWRSRRDQPRHGLLIPGIGLVLTALVGYIGGTVFWPWALLDPVQGPVLALQEMSAFPWHGDMVFRGDIVHSTRLPWDYIPHYLLITTPLVVLGGALACGLLGNSPRKPRYVSLIALFSAFPVVAIIVKDAVLYDGIRHLLFVYPGLVVLAAIGITRLLRLVRHPAGRCVFWLALACGVALPANAMVELHPFQTSYFNEFVGGLRGAAGRYYTDYWGTCVKQAVTWLEDEAQRRNTRLDVSSNLYEEMIAWQVRKPGSMRYRFPEQSVDYHVRYLGRATRAEIEAADSERVAFRVTAANTPLCLVENRQTIEKETSFSERL